MSDFYYNAAGEHKTNTIIRGCVERGMKWDAEQRALTLPSGKVRTRFPIIRGYRTLTLTYEQQWRSVILARVICWLTYGEPPFGKAVVDHIDRNKLNDSPSNLRWVDRATNMRNVAPGARTPRSKRMPK